MLLKAIKKADGVYELDNWHLYPSTNLAMCKSNSSLKMTLHWFIRNFLNPKATPFKDKEIEKEKEKILEEQENNYKRRNYRISDSYKFLYCCGCKQKVMATEIKQKKKYYFKCDCGLIIETDNNPDFPQPLGNICNKELKNAKLIIFNLINDFHKSYDELVELFKFITEKLNLKSQLHIGNIKTIKEARKVYKIIKSYINQDLINVEKII